jgi:hypothetical protein
MDRTIIIIKAEPELLSVVKHLRQLLKQSSPETRGSPKGKAESIRSFRAIDLSIALNKTEILNNKMAAM